MKKVRQFTATVLAAALMLLSVGCADAGVSDSQGKEPLGRYIEKEITPPAAVPKEGGRPVYALGIYPEAGGAIYYLGLQKNESDEAKYTLIHSRSSDGGETWEAMDAEWYDKLYAQYGLPGSSLLKRAALGSDGAIYCLLMVENNWFKAVRVKDGAFKEIPIEGWDEQAFYNGLQGFYIQAFEALSNGDIAVSFDIFDPYSYVYDGNTGRLKEQIETQDAAVYFGADCYAKVAYDDSVQNNALTVFRYGGEKISVQSLGDISSEAFNLTGTAETMFLLTETGAYSFSGDAAQTGRIMEPGLYTFGSPTWYVTSFKYDDVSKALYAILKSHDNGEERLFRYTFDETVPVRAAEQLTVYSLQDSDTLRQAVSVYQREHPEVAVEVEIALSNDSAITKEDTIRVLNTELLAGRGPDIIILDGLPVETYIEKGVLQNLSDVVNDEEFFPNLAKAYATDQGVYAIPGRCLIPVMCGEKAFVNSLENLTRIAEHAQKLPALPPQTEMGMNQRIPREMRPLAFINSYSDTVRLFYSTYGNELIGTDQTVNREILNELLSESKKLYQRYSVSDNDVPMETELSRKVLSYLPRDVYGERTLLGITNLSDFRDCLRIAMSVPSENGAKMEDIDLYFKPLCGADENVFIPRCVAALNTSSQRIDMGKEFIRTLLSEAVQTPSYSEGFPVNRRAFRIALARSKENVPIVYTADMEQLAASLTTPVTIDETILEAVLDEVKPYYKDEETLEEAVDHIGAKLRTYLAEKS